MREWDDGVDLTVTKWMEISVMVATFFDFLLDCEHLIMVDKLSVYLPLTVHN